MSQLFRSETYQRLYPDELMLEAFGKLNPSASEKQLYFFDLWAKRRPNRIMIEKAQHDYRENNFKLVLKQMGLREPWEYQIKGSEVRFEHAQDLAMFKIAQRNTQ